MPSLQGVSLFLSTFERQRTTKRLAYASSGTRLAYVAVAAGDQAIEWALQFSDFDAPKVSCTNQAGVNGLPKLRLITKEWIWRLER